MFGKISEEEKDDAIRYLMDNIPRDCLNKVRVMVQNNKSCWSFAVNMGFGIYVRNVLREGGFDWGPLTLDTLWSTLIEEAARRVEIAELNS
jgi:hypothetical protein